MKRILIFLIPWLALTACKEDVDDEAPVVSISAPLDGLTIIMPDTIGVSASAQDNERLEILNFGLVDANLNWVGERIYISDPSNPNSFNIALPVTDLDIASGTHYVEVLAGDGSNDERAFVEVNVIAIPRTFLGTVYAYPAGGSVSAGYSDAVGATSTYSSDEEGMCVVGDGRQGAVYAYSQSVQSLSAFRLEDGEMEWSNTGITTSGESVIDCLYDTVDRTIVLLTDEPGILRYNRFGTALGAIDLDADYDAIAMIADADDYWVLSNSSTGHRLSRIFKSSGFEIEHFSLPYEPVRMTRFNEDEIVLVDTEGEIHVLNTVNGAQFGISSAAGGDVSGLVAVNGKAFISSAEGIFRFDPSSAQVPQVYASTSITGMTYDAVGQRLIVADGTELQFYDPSLWQFLGSMAVPEGASDLQALFNK